MPVSVTTRLLVQQIVDAVDAAVVVVDDHFVVDVWNKAAERAYGWTAEQATGRLAFDLIPPAEYPEGMSAEAALDVALRKGSWEGEITLTRQDGSRILTEASIRPLLDDAENVVGYAIVNRNITGHRAVEDELAALKGQEV